MIVEQTQFLYGFSSGFKIELSESKFGELKQEEKNMKREHRGERRSAGMGRWGRVLDGLVGTNWDIVGVLQKEWKGTSELLSKQADEIGRFREKVRGEMSGQRLGDGVGNVVFQKGSNTLVVGAESAGSSDDNTGRAQGGSGANAAGEAVWSSCTIL